MIPPFFFRNNFLSHTNANKFDEEDEADQKKKKQKKNCCYSQGVSSYGRDYTPLISA